MQYSEIKTTFTGILNRRDITASQITTFLNMGVQYIERKLRVPPMETLLEHTCDGTKYIPVPTDMLELIAIYGDDTANHGKLERRDLRTVLVASQEVGVPRYFYRANDQFMVGPVPAAGQVVYLAYYARGTTLSADTDTNWWTTNAPTALVYAGLIYASDHFLDDRKKAFEARLLEDLADIQEMYNRDELAGGTMSAVYPDQN